MSQKSSRQEKNPSNFKLNYKGDETREPFDDMDLKEPPPKKVKEDIFLKDIKIKFEYGRAEFSKASQKEIFYIDKTSFIPKLEDAGDCLLFLRPRRFGKSMIISMLEYYYDILYKDKFLELFGHLDIGKNPTKERNSYLVLNLNFSNLVVHQGVREFEESLNNHINNSIADFQDKYSKFLNTKIEIDQRDSVNSFERISSIAKNRNFKVLFNLILDLSFNR